MSSELLRRLVTPGQLFPDMGAALAEMQVGACMGREGRGVAVADSFSSWLKGGFGV